MKSPPAPLIETTNNVLQPQPVVSSSNPTSPSPSIVFGGQALPLSEERSQQIDVGADGGDEEVHKDERSKLEQEVRQEVIKEIREEVRESM